MRILLNNGDGWSVDATIALPYDCLNTTTSKTGDVGGIATCYTNQTFRSYLYINAANILNFETAYTNASGSNQKAMVQGWFYRN
jgi:heptaprenylglyceryl phosphate synthase